MASGIGITNSDVGMVGANITKPGPTGTVGDMKTNPVANPNINQTDVASTQFVSRQTTDVVNPGTQAGRQKEDDNEQASLKHDPDVQRSLHKAVFTNSSRPATYHAGDDDIPTSA